MLDDIPGFGVEGQIFELPNLLVELYENKRNHAVLGDLVWGLAWAIDDSLPSSDWVENPLDIMGALCDMLEKGGPIDTDVVRAIRGLSGPPHEVNIVPANNACTRHVLTFDLDQPGPK